MHGDRRRYDRGHPDHPDGDRDYDGLTQRFGLFRDLHAQPGVGGDRFVHGVVCPFGGRGGADYNHRELQRRPDPRWELREHRTHCDPDRNDDHCELLAEPHIEERGVHMHGDRI